jgi:hypothetical protein
VKSAKTVDAKKNKLSADEALELAATVDQIYIAKGSKVVHFDVKKDKPTKETLLTHMLGPTGNLRAPAMRVGKTLVVGYNADIYDMVFE